MFSSKSIGNLIYGKLGKWVNGSWDERLKQLLEYTQKHEDTNVPDKYQDTSQLKMWISGQRNAYKNAQEFRRDWLHNGI